MTTVALPYGASVAICAVAPVKPSSAVNVGRKAAKAAPEICCVPYMRTAGKIRMERVYKCTENLLPANKRVAYVLPIDGVFFFTVLK